MCRHNDDWCDYCAKCCYEHGNLDALEGLPSLPEYKNIWQCDEYYLGYNVGLQDLSENK